MFALRISISAMIILVVCLIVISSTKNPEILHPVFVWVISGLTCVSAITVVVSLLFYVWSDDF